MSTKKIVKVLALSVAFLLIMFTLIGCGTYTEESAEETSSTEEVTDETEELTGFNVIWTPAVWLWEWLWHSFTPDFWKFMGTIITLPESIAWLATPIAYILGFALYVCIAIIIMVIDIVIAIACGIVWFILSVLNGIFHFV